MIESFCLYNIFRETGKLSDVFVFVYIHSGRVLFKHSVPNALNYARGL